MKKTLEYLHQIYRSTEDREINGQIALIGRTLFIAQEGWNYYFSLSVLDTDSAVNEAIKIGVFNSIFSIKDRIFSWSGKKISFKNGSKLKLVCLMRNYITHGDKDFELPMWSGDELGIDKMSFLNIEKLPEVRFEKWVQEFILLNKEDWWEEDGVDDLKNKIIQDALDLQKTDLNVIDNEMLEMVSDYFDKILILYAINHFYSSKSLRINFPTFPPFKG